MSVGRKALLVLAAAALAAVASHRWHRRAAAGEDGHDRLGL